MVVAPRARPSTRTKGGERAHSAVCSQAIYSLETGHGFSYEFGVASLIALVVAFVALLAMPTDKGQKEHVAVRLDADTVARLEALLHLYALPGRRATRSDGLRAVILAGLAVEEERAARLARDTLSPEIAGAADAEK